MTTPSIPLDIRYGRDDDFDQINPWWVRDGKWGGFGPQYWHRGFNLGFLEGDVLERDHTRWVRIWDNTAQTWRPLTFVERTMVEEQMPIELPQIRLKRDMWPGRFWRPTAEELECFSAFVIPAISLVIDSPDPVITDLFTTDTHTP